MIVGFPSMKVLDEREEIVKKSKITPADKELTILICNYFYYQHRLYELGTRFIYKLFPKRVIASKKSKLASDLDICVSNIEKKVSLIQ